MVTRGAVVVGATVVVGGTVTTGAVVVVTGSEVVVGVARTVVVVVSAGASVSTYVVTARDDELFVESFDTISLFDMPGNACASRAARPATCGAAIDVPEIVRVADEPPTQAEVMLVPGAQRSTHDPKFEYAACASARSIAPIVSADGARAGEDEHASVELFPAATTTVRPAAVALATAESMAVLAEPPRLKLIMPAPPGWL